MQDFVAPVAPSAGSGDLHSPLGWLTHLPPLYSHTPAARFINQPQHMSAPAHHSLTAGLINRLSTGPWAPVGRPRAPGPSRLLILTTDFSPQFDCARLLPWVCWPFALHPWPPTLKGSTSPASLWQRHLVEWKAANINHAFAFTLCDDSRT